MNKAPNFDDTFNLFVEGKDSVQRYRDFYNHAFDHETVLTDDEIINMVAECKKDDLLPNEWAEDMAKRERIKTLEKIQSSTCTPFITNINRYVFGAFVVEHQFSDTPKGFVHRVKCETNASEWMGYTFFASLHSPYGLFIGTTEYYSDLPACFKAEELTDPVV